ncbi:MAG: type II secretion system protein [Alphaproteobacteria bacterium]|nr:type II secretion system protein [Alphaproteobacteria bacterium]
MRKVCEIGRSMVEMLGVLAIIGVLSVGGIAGYSKAMRKHKLNQHAVAINTLINNAMQIKDRLDKASGDSNIHYNEIFHKLGLLPDGIKYVSQYQLRDIFNIHIYIYSHPDGFSGIEFLFEDKLNDMADVCRNIVYAAKENADNLWVLETADSDDTETSWKGFYYGSAYCNVGTRKCLSTITLAEMEDLCKCTNNKCEFFVLWK